MQWNKKDGRMTALNLVNATKTAAKVTLSLFDIILFHVYVVKTYCLFIYLSFSYQGTI